MWGAAPGRVGGHSFFIFLSILPRIWCSGTEFEFTKLTGLLSVPASIS